MSMIAKRRPRAGVVFLALCIACVIAACDRQGQRRELRGGTMGTTWSVVYAQPVGVDSEDLQARVEAELVAVNAAMSTYLPDSEISRFNRLSEASKAGETVRLTLSPGFATVVDMALRIGASTDGAYDITVGPLIELWGFGTRVEEDALPEASAIAAAQDRVGADRLRWDPTSRNLTAPTGLRLDLSSIAKGYAVDRVVAVLAEAGVEQMLVEIGGELRAVGERPGGGAWRLAVESPIPEGERFIEALAVRDAAVATSGDYRNYFEIDGQRYSHLVDPRTGRPVAHDLVSVTVIHPQCMVADAWATALIVLGKEQALRLAEEQSLAVMLVARDGDELALDYSPTFAPFLQRRAADGESGDNCCGLEH